MKKKVLIGLILSSFLLLMVPNVNAIQSIKVDKQLEDKIENQINLFQTKLNDFSNLDLINPFIMKILMIVYIMGYFAFLPFAWFLTLFNNPYGNPSFLERLIRTVFGSFLWPIVVLDIIRAYIEGLRIP